MALGFALVWSRFRSSDVSGEGTLETSELDSVLHDLFPDLSVTMRTGLMVELSWNDRDIEGSGVTEEECASA